MIDDEPWFVLKDVCDALLLTSAHKVADRLDDDDRSQVPVIDSMGRSQLTTVINEAGLYTVILRSEKQEARDFKRWITHDVLPAIRQTGSYSISTAQPKLVPMTQKELASPEHIAAVISALHADNQELRTVVEQQNVLLLEQSSVIEEQEQRLEELHPKVNYYDQILQSKDTICISAIAKDYGMEAMDMNALLCSLGVQYKLPTGQWLLKKKYNNKGYVQSKTYNFKHKDGSPGSKVHTYWTQKGRLFLYDFLKARGFVPLVEQDTEAL